VGKSLDQYRSTCRFGTSYAVIESDYADIKAETTYFVPLDQDFEYWWLRVSNTSGSSRRLSVFSFAEFTSEWNMSNDLLNLQYSAHIVEAKLAGDVVSVSTCGRLPRDQANFGNRDQSRWWWMAQTGAPMSGYDLDREAFIGPYRSFHNPAAVERGLCLGSEAYGDNACGAIQSDIELAPGETRSILVLLGVGKADRDGAKIIQEFATPERAQQELVALKRYWHGLLESLRCDTPDDDFDHMVNVWNAYNAMITFTWSRACSLVYTGENRDGLGYRDSVQDAMGVVSLVPAQARERLELMFAGQESTGGARPEIKPWLHKPGHMPPTPADGYRSDDCLWFFNAIPAYLGETGDVDFLQLVLPYSDCGEDTVFAHLRRALEFNLERTGQNGLPCGLQADWNDCLKLGYRGESVFVAFQVRFGLGVYARLPGRTSSVNLLTRAFRRCVGMEAGSSGLLRKTALCMAARTTRKARYI
jgi:cellobiose phosphorylase